MSSYLLDLPAVVAFSGGRTSGYMLRKILDAHGGQPDDLKICFQNTGLEHHETYEFVNRCAIEWDVHIDWLEMDLDEDNKWTYKVVDYESAARNGEPFMKLIVKKNFLPNPIARMCTAEMKVRTQRRWLLDNPVYEDGYMIAIGLRADEPRRALRIKGDIKREEVICPLYHEGVTREDVDEWWEQQPFNLNLPLGGNMAGNCVGCFLKGKARLEMLMKEMPEYFDWWIGAEGACPPNPQMGHRFRVDRPDYETMMDTIKRQGWLFAPSDLVDDNTIPCMCTD